MSVKQGVLLCETCSKQIQDFHYDFESIIFSDLLGQRCSDCDRVTCWTHRWSDGVPGERCSCGGRVVVLMEGPALSSMVDAAKRDGKYGGNIRPPDATRRVKQG